MSDNISRQAAIDAVDHICPVDTDYDCTLLDRVDVRYVLSDLPSAQPEKRTQERTETNSCDLISRQTAIDALAVEFYNCADDYRTAVKVIEGLPSTEPKTKCIAQIRIDRDDMKDLVNEKVNEIVDKMAEPKTGRWTNKHGRAIPDEYCVYCSRCKKWSERASDYCPNCGAYMRGADDETIAD